MRRVLLNEQAADQVMRLREDKFGAYSDEKCNIADAFGHLTTMLTLSMWYLIELQIRFKNGRGFKTTSK